MIKKYVKIQSNIDINVTAGLYNLDVTNPDAHIPDRLKVKPVWPKITCMIYKGVHWYPSEIASWNTVKALVKDRVITIGEYSDSCDDEKTVENKQKIINGMKEVSKLKEVNLKEIARNKEGE